MPLDRFQGTPRFRVVRVLGEGGMGVVYEVQDTSRNARVALKTMHGANPGALIRFKKEFRALADLVHPNLASLHELFVEGETPFFTMELVDGIDFIAYARSTGAALPFAATEGEAARATPWAATTQAAARAARSQPLDVDRLRRVLRQLVVGVQALHEAGKLHRDLKPSNVLVTREERVVILDFGLVVEIDDLGDSATGGDRFVGTLEYMSPEQAACSDLAAPSDWYAVGVMLYEALTGRLPFTSRGIQLLRDKQERDPPAPSTIVDDVPDDLATLAMQLLARDPAARPKGTRLLERVGAARTPTAAAMSSTGAAHGILVGREAQLASLLDAFAGMLDGRPVIAHVRGASGMGKSALVRHAMEEMARERDADLVVLAGRCYEQESVPYKAVDSVIDSLSRYLRALPKERAAALVPSHVDALARLFPVLRRVEAIANAPKRGAEITDPQELRRRAFGVLRSMLERIAERSPMVVWIDDLQWGDVDSGMLLGELLRPPDPPPFLLIVSYRTEADADVGCLATLRRIEGQSGGAEAKVIDVGPLATEDAKNLAAALFRSAADCSARSDEALQWIAVESAGNPFLLAEIVRYQQSGAGSGRVDSAPIHLEDVVESRLAQFSEAARLLVELVAVAGHPLELEVAVAAAELDATAARSAVSQLRAAQIVRTARVHDREGLDTFHDRIRETTIRLLSGSALARRHERLVAAIGASRNPDPEALAAHCMGAGDRLRASRFAEEAGAQAVAALAFDRAAEWFRRALEWRPFEPAAERRARTRLAEALSNAGRGAHAGREYLRAAALPSEGDGADLHQLAAGELLMSGQMDEGIAVVRGVLDSIGSSYPSTQWLAMLLFLATSVLLRVRGTDFRAVAPTSVRPVELRRIDTFIMTTMGLIFTDTMRGRYFSNRAVLAALRIGEPRRAFLTLTQVMMNLSAAGARLAPRIRRIEARVVELEGDLKSPFLTAQRQFASGWSRLFLGHFPEGEKLLQEASDGFQELAGLVTWQRDSVRMYLVASIWWLGRVRELGARVAEYREDALRRGDKYMTSFLSSGNASATWLAADAPERAILDATASFEAWPSSANDAQRYYWLTACVQAELYRGDGRSGLARMRIEWVRLRRAFLLRVQLIRTFALHLRGRAAIATLNQDPGDRAVRRDADRCIRALARETFPCALAMARSLAASLLLRDGRRDEAAEAYAEAAQLFEAQSMSFFAAACRYRYGETVGGEAGRALIAAVETLMTAETVKNPARMVDMLVPSARASG